MAEMLLQTGNSPQTKGKKKSLSYGGVEEYPIDIAPVLVGARTLV